MNTFLKTYSLPRLNNIEIDNLNKPIIRKEIELVIKYLPTKKSLGPDCYCDEFHQPFREELTAILLKLFKILKSREHFQTHFTRSALPCYQSQIEATEKENYRSIFLMNTNAHNLNKIVTNQIQQHIKKIIHLIK